MTTRPNNVVLLIIMKILNKNILKIFLTTATVVFSFSYFNKLMAAPLESRSDTMSRLGSSSVASVYSDHTFQFVTPSGVASTETIVITLPADFDGTGLDDTDVDLFIDSTPDGVCEGDAVGQTIVAAAPTGSQWSAVFSGTENRTLTLTSGGASAIVGAGNEVCIEVGQNATGGTANSQYLNPTTLDSFTISITAGADSGDIVVEIIENDVVTITAKVNETITFAISDYEVGFGTLTSANARFATGVEPYGANGPTATSAHTMSVATNGSSGYDITYRGLALMSGTDNIDPATITGDQDGTPSTEQFAIGFTTSDDATVATAYNQTNPTFNYSFVEDAETPFVSETAPTATETITAYYLANISGLTPAGSYSTAITYVATANF